MTDSEAEAENINTGTRELLREARRLGLTWGLRPGTVSDPSHVVYDGDSEDSNTRVINLLESPLFVDERVMCMFVPPAGNFVVGVLTDLKVLFRARRAAAQLIPNSSETPVEWDTIDVDTHSAWNAGSPDSFTAPFAGWYQLSGGVGWASGGTGTGRRGAFWRLNSSAPSVDGGASFIGGAGSTGTHSIPARVMTLAVEKGDSVQLMAFQEQGSSLNTATGSSCPSIDVQYIRSLAVSS